MLSHQTEVKIFTKLNADLLINVRLTRIIRTHHLSPDTFNLPDGCKDISDKFRLTDKHVYGPNTHV